MAARPLLRWAGSKRQLVGVLRTYWRADHRRYVEPFAGSACLFFAISPTNAILGDLNGELIATYEQIRDDVETVRDELATFGIGKDEYYRVREMPLESLSPARRAARFIYLNRYCFNGLYRTNQLGKYNVPFGGKKTGSLPSPEHLRAVAHRLSGVTLVNSDFGEVLDRTIPGDFVYMDPPYRVSSRRTFREYDASAFSANDLTRLREWMDRLTSRGVEFVVSYAACPEGRSLEAGYQSEVVSVRRNIAGFAGDRRITDEVIVSNYRAIVQ
ncbi:MAG: Dam family site-specific DNA-(adenine-N6)-methyltransferase [Gemmatimonadetes bacterium]|nr:Dam family site-specific DNA-(adenine-N6)-methyltransferase [Gemmatimonadota bacterium]